MMSKVAAGPAILFATALVVVTGLFSSTEADAIAVEMWGSQTSLTAETVVAPSTTTTTTMAVETTTSTVPAPSTTTTAPDPRLDHVPSTVLAPIGGRTAVTVVEAQTADGTLDGWVGSHVNFTSGLAVMSKGLFTRPADLTAPFVVLGRISHSDGAAFEVMVESGAWATSGLRRWGFYVRDDEVTLDVWEGTRMVGPEMPGIPVPSGEFYWVMLGISDHTALLGVMPDVPGAEMVGVTWDFEWDVPGWDLAIQVFSGGGVANVDEYFILSP